MKSAPTQGEVKSLFSLVIPRGNGKVIAQGLGVTESDWSRRINPNDDRKLATAEALREHFQIIQTCPEQWPMIREYIQALWDEWETGGRLPVPSADQVAKAQHDYLSAELQHLDPPRRGLVLSRAVALSKRRLMYLESGTAQTRRAG